MSVRENSFNVYFGKNANEAVLERLHNLPKERSKSSDIADVYTKFVTNEFIDKEEHLRQINQLKTDLATHKNLIDMLTSKLVSGSNKPVVENAEFLLKQSNEETKVIEETGSIEKAEVVNKKRTNNSSKEEVSPKSRVFKKRGRSLEDIMSTV